MHVINLELEVLVVGMSCYMYLIVIVSARYSMTVEAWTAIRQDLINMSDVISPMQE